MSDRKNMNSCDWGQRGLRVRLQLRRHKVPDTARRLMESLIDISYGFGIDGVKVPSLKYFCSLTGMEKPHVCDAIAWLHLQRMIRMRAMEGGGVFYEIRDDANIWKVSLRELMEDADERIKQLRAINGLNGHKKGERQ